MERIIPKKNPTTKAICSLSVLNKARSEINHMTNAIYLQGGKEGEKYHGRWVVTGNEAAVWKVLIVCLVIYLYFLNPPSSSYTITYVVKKFPPIQEFEEIIFPVVDVGVVTFINV